MYKFIRYILFFLCIFTLPISYSDSLKIGSVTGLAIPRFVVIKSKDTNMRSGPGVNYPNKINYKCIFMPVEVQEEFENWRLVRDIDGNEGWIHEAMLDGRRYVQIISSKTLDQNNKEVLIFRLPNPQSKPIVRVEVGTIGKLIQCQNEWCQISFGRAHKGWIPKNKLWGVYSNE
jgi:SH3-like domain-containing protein